jgi:PKD repeat protein
MKRTIPFVSSLFYFILLLAPHLSVSQSLSSDDQAAEQIHPSTNALDATFRSYEVVQFELDSHLVQLQNTGQTQLVISFDRKNHVLDVSKNGLIADNYSLRTPSGLSRTKPAIPTDGFTASGERVAMTINHNFLYGSWSNEKGERIFVEPLRFHNKLAEADQHLIYYSKDVLDTTTGSCGITAEHHIHADKPNRRAPSGMENNDCLEVEIALAADYLMFEKYGSVQDVEDRNIGVMNDVQTNYSGEFDYDLLYEIVEQFVSDCPSCDPWTSSTDPGTLLNSFTDWAPTGFNATHDVGQLWSDRNFNGGTIGLAWVSAICTGNRYNICEDFSNNSELIRVLSAHELGHNFSLVHDAAGSDFIMAPSVNNSNDWSNNSVNDINDYLPRPCLDDCELLPVSDFGVVNTDICEGTDVYFYSLASGPVEEHEWSFPGGSPSSSDEEFPVVNYSSSGTYSVTLTVIGPNGEEDTQTQNGIINVGPNGQTVLWYQDFESGIDDWIIENETNNGWDITSATDGSTYGTEALWVDNFNNGPTSNEDLKSPVFSLEGYDEATLHLDYAYCRKNGTSDSLIISVSTDGGATFTQVAGYFETGSGNYATTFNSGNPLVPTEPDQWCLSGIGNDCLEIPLSGFAQQPNVQVRIRNKSLGGNNLYVDRVWLTTDCFELFPPEADFTSDVTEGCASFAVQFEDLTNGVVDQYNWSFPGGTPNTSTEANPEVFYTDRGVYDVELTVSNAVGQDVAFKSGYIIVEDVPEPDFSFSVFGREVAFLNTTPNGLAYEWDFGDGINSTEENPTHTYAFDGDYNVILSATNQCGTEEIEKIVSIDANPQAAFDASSTTICAGESVEFDASSSVNADGFSWTFTGGTPGTATGESPVITYEEKGIYDVTLIVVNNFGSDTITQTDYIEVLPNPQVDFDFTADELIVEFTNQSSNYDDLSWFFGDGSTSSAENPTHTYAEAGTYDVMLIASSASCGPDTLIQQISVDEGVQADIAWDGETTGCTPFTVNFEGLPADAETFSWTFDGGQPATSTEANPEVTYSESGTYTVTLVVTQDGDADTLSLSDVIQVNEGPEVDFAFSTTEREVAYTNLSSNFDDVLWTFGDGNESSEENPVYTYASDGQYTVTLTAWNGCDTLTVEQNITIATLPTADFAIAGDAEGCIPLEVTFQDNSSENTIGREWIFEGGNPSTSTDESPRVSYAAAGNYDVMLIVESLAGFDTMEMADAVTVNPDVEIDFDQLVDSLQVTFSNASSDATSFMWSFGDGNSSTDENPTHTYAEPGIYEVSLMAMNECDTAILDREIGVGGVPTANFTVEGSPAGCAPFEVQFENTSDGVIGSVEWIFDGGSPATSTEENPIVTYTESGLYDVTLIATNAAGTNQYTRQQFVRVNVFPDAEASFESQDEFTYQFESEIDDALSVDFRWEFGDGNESLEEDPTHTYAEDGVYEALFIWSNDCGVDTISMEIEIISSSVVETTLQSVRVFPNPTSGQVTIDGMPISAQLTIYDMNGKEMLDVFRVNSSRQNLRLVDFSAGMYIISIRHEGFTERRKLVVK